MPNYRLVFRGSPEQSPIKSVSFRGKDPGEALLLAQRHACPVELWSEDHHICTINRAGSEGPVWIISKGEEPGSHSLS